MLRIRKQEHITWIRNYTLENKYFMVDLTERTELYADKGFGPYYTNKLNVLFIATYGTRNDTHTISTVDGYTRRLYLCLTWIIMRS